MENSSCFDLNEAVRRWRNNLAQSPVLRARDIEELETHLRDSVLALQISGLTPEEAFLIASRRMGQRQELEREFGKTNLKRIWMDRGLWMISGLLLYSFVGSCSGFVSHTIFMRALAMSVNAQWAFFLSELTRWTFMALAVTGFWWLVTRCHERLGQFARLCLRRPLLPVIAIVALNYSYSPVVQWLMNVTAPALTPNISRQFPILPDWAAWCYDLFGVLVWMAAPCYLARRQWQISESATPAHNMRTIEELESPLRESARALLAKGLSVEEAICLVTRRKGPRQESTFEMEEASLRQVWIERGVWLIGGILFFKYFFLTELSLVLSRLMLNLANSWSVNGHLLGVFSFCLQWVTVAVVVAGLWRLVWRHQQFSARVARFIQQRPMLGVTAVLLVYLGFGTLLWLLGQVTPMTLNYQNPTHILVQRWNVYGHQFLYNVVSVLLLFWLARQRLRFQEAR